MIYLPKCLLFSQNTYIIGRKNIKLGKKGADNMRKFDYNFLKNRTWDNEILSYVVKFMSIKGNKNFIFVQNL